MSMAQPSPVDVSVIIPSHNRPEYLPDCVASILEQEWSGSLEIICVDDGSEIDPFASLPDPLPANVRLFRKANEGVSATRRYGFEQASGRYIAFNDDDDIWLPGRLQTQFAFLETHPDIDLIFSDLIEFDDEGDRDETHFTGRVAGLQRLGKRIASTDLSIHRFEPGSLISAFMTNIPLFFQTVLARRALVDRIGGMHQSLRSAAECTDFALRTSYHGVTAYLDQPTFRLRRGHVHETADAGWLDRDIREFLEIYPAYPDGLKRLLEPWLGGHLANKGWFHFKRAEYRQAATAYSAAARHGRISAQSRIKWGLAAVMGLFERDRIAPSLAPDLEPANDDKESDHASTG